MHYKIGQKTTFFLRSTELRSIFGRYQQAFGVRSGTEFYLNDGSKWTVLNSRTPYIDVKRVG